MQNPQDHNFRGGGYFDFSTPRTPPVPHQTERRVHPNGAPVYPQVGESYSTLESEVYSTLEVANRYSQHAPRVYRSHERSPFSAHPATNPRWRQRYHGPSLASAHAGPSPPHIQHANGPCPLSGYPTASPESVARFQMQHVGIHHWPSMAPGDVQIHNWQQPIPAANTETGGAGSEKAAQLRVFGMARWSFIILTILICLVVGGSVTGGLLASIKSSNVSAEDGSVAASGAAWPSISTSSSPSMPISIFAAVPSASSSTSALPPSNTTTPASTLTTTKKPSLPIPTKILSSCPDDNLVCPFTHNRWYNIGMDDLDDDMRDLCHPPTVESHMLGVGWCPIVPNWEKYQYWQFEPVPHEKPKSWVTDPEDNTQTLRTYMLHNLIMGPGLSLSLQLDRTVDEAETSDRMLGIHLQSTHREDTWQYWYFVKKVMKDGSGEYWVIRNVESGQAYMLTGQRGSKRPIKSNQDDAQKQQVDCWGDGSRRWVIQASDLMIVNSEVVNGQPWGV